MATVSTKSQKRDDFIKSVDFFDMEKYPTMKLRLLEHNGDKVIMELTIKDITKNIKMQIKDIKEGSFTLHGEINRKDFQLKFNKIGDATVGNTVKIRLKIEGVLTN
ncbi:MAG TPA: YceI family protein [Campylobacterales bacterium]|nr:YceI family protein [Campylobacterales bacterium]